MSNKYSQQFRPKNHTNYEELWERFLEKHPQYNNYTASELKKINENWWSFCGNILTENKHGIILNQLGYFGNAVFQNKKVRVFRDSSKFINFHSNGDIYTCYFFPRIFKRNPFRSWSFRLNKNHRLAIHQNVSERGFKYTNHYSLLHKGSNIKYFYGDAR